MKLNEIAQTEIERLLQKYKIKNYTVRKDGLVDVEGDIALGFYLFDKLPIKFDRVKGNFDLQFSKLETLEGSPQWVGEWFSCAFCREIFSLQYSPIYVNGFFNCNGCWNLESLDYLPKQINGILYLGDIPKVKDVLKIFKTKGITEIIHDNKQLEKIINKYLPKRDMLNCQDELIEAGLEKYAEIE